MKKIIIGALVAGCLLFASEKPIELKSNLFDLNKVESEEMKDWLLGVEALMPSIAEIIKDYYEAKTCSVDFYNKVTIQDTKDFVTTSPFDTLIELNTVNMPAYNQLINDYKFMNCGIGKISGK